MIDNQNYSSEDLLLRILSTFSAIEKTQADMLFSDRFKNSNGSWFFSRMVRQGKIFENPKGNAYYCATPRIKPSRRMAEAIWVLMEYVNLDELLQSQPSYEPFGIRFYYEGKEHLILCADPMPELMITKLNRMTDMTTMHIMIISDEEQAELLEQKSIIFPHLFVTLSRDESVPKISFFSFNSVSKEVTNV